MPHNTCQIYLTLLTITHPGCCLSCVFVKSLKVFLFAPPLAPIFPLPSIILFAIGVLNHLKITRAHHRQFLKIFSKSVHIFYVYHLFDERKSPPRWKNFSQLDDVLKVEVETQQCLTSFIPVCFVLEMTRPWLIVGITKFHFSTKSRNPGQERGEGPETKEEEGSSPEQN